MSHTVLVEHVVQCSEGYKLRARGYIRTIDTKQTKTGGSMKAKFGTVCRRGFSRILYTVFILSEARAICLLTTPVPAGIDVGMGSILRRYRTQKKTLPTSHFH